MEVFKIKKVLKNKNSYVNSINNIKKISKVKIGFILLLLILLISINAINAIDLNDHNINLINDSNNDININHIESKNDNYNKNTNLVNSNLDNSKNYNNYIINQDNISNNQFTSSNFIYVSNNGSDDGDGSIANPYKSLGNAILKSENGDSIYLNSGNYSGINNYNLNINKNLNIFSLSTLNDVCINGEKNNILTITNSVVNIEGLSFINAYGSEGGAITIDNNSSLILNKCTLFNNSASGYGGAILNLGGKLTINNSLINSNHGSQGGAIRNTGNLLIENSTIVNNSAIYGGVIYNLNTCILNNITAFNNSASSAGSVVFNLKNNLKIANSKFFSNNAYDGGVFYNDIGVIIINNSYFENNSANHFGGVIDNSNLVNISNSYFNKNSAVAGGGILDNDGNLTIFNSTLSHNSGKDGGFMICRGNANISYCNILSNSATTGDAIYAIGNVIANYNWWGTNNPKSSLFYGNVNYSNYIYLTLNYDSLTTEKLNKINISLNNYYDNKINSIKNLDSNFTINKTGILTLNPFNNSTKINIINGKFNNNIYLPLFTNNISFTLDNEIITAKIDSNTSIIQTILESNNFTKVFGIAKNFTVCLKTINGYLLSGKEISFKLINQLGESKIYWATTNTEGIAKLAINLIPGEFYIETNFNGDENYLTSQNYSTLNINENNKTKTYLHSLNSSFKPNSGENFTVSLYDENNIKLIGYELKLTLVNALGETKDYWSTTNIEGIAKLVINLVYPSNYKIISSFEGNSIYINSTTDSTITIY